MLRPFARTAPLLVLLLIVAGCGPPDPLEAIRQRQEGGDYAGSIEPLRALLLEQPKNAEANYLYGRALVLTGQHSLASWALREAMNDPAWLIPAGMQYAHASLVTQDFNEVVKITTRVLESHPEHAQALLFRAQAHAHWKAHPEQALVDADRALELQPDLIEAYEPRILALLALERQEEAEAALAEAGLRLEEQDAPASVLGWHCSTTAVFAVDAGELDRAREIWRECLAKYPADATVVLQAVEFHDRAGEISRSVEILRAAFAEREDRGFRLPLADRLRATGQAAEGEALLRAATEVEDARLAATAWSDLAVYRHGLAEHGAAADALARSVERIREVEEASPELLFRYADALILSNQLRLAAEVTEQIAVPAQRHLLRGRIAQESGDPVRALREFDEALRLWPDNAAARYYAAREAEKLGDFDRALEEYRYSIRIDMGATDARTRAARLLIAQQEYRQAYQLLFLQAAEHPLEPEGELLGLYLIARVGNAETLRTQLALFSARAPRRLPLALSRASEGLAELAGPGAALDLLVSAPGIDYADPSNAPALRAVARFARAADSEQAAASRIDAALAAHPEVADFHEIRGLHLELGGAAPAAARAAYTRALELDATHAGALAGLARLALPDDPAAAAALFDRAAAADPDAPEPKLEAARALRASGRPEEAARRLEALLVAHPLVGEAAAERVALDLEAGVVTPQTLEYARRAARFGGGADAYEQLSLVHARLEQPEAAAEAARRAGVLREHQAARSPEG